MPTIKPSLWFDDNLEEAMEFYTKLFPHSSVGDVQRWGPGQPGPEGQVLAASFNLAGLEFTGINGGPEHAGFTETISFVLECADQAEIDHYWDALTADGGEEGPCGWLTDKFGLSWQVVPAGLGDLLSAPEAMQAMLGMKKLVVADLK
jgi:predicted 3-demethylubiquinone-9 3-methyltransferase (glyoxalase superfamily)